MNSHPFKVANDTEVDPSRASCIMKRYGEGGRDYFSRAITEIMHVQSIHALLCPRSLKEQVQKYPVSIIDDIDHFLVEQCVDHLSKATRVI